MATSKHVAVTATTGMASSQLGLGSTTVHHLCGILDGRYNVNKMKELFDNGDSCAAAKKRIQNAEVLVIDEIGMLSRKIFEMIESVCRYVRQTPSVFGGLQVIASGDFKQLPPVPKNYRFGDDGAYCFQSELFNVVFPHHINLVKICGHNGLINAPPTENLNQRRGHFGIAVWRDP